MVIVDRRGRGPAVVRSSFGIVDTVEYITIRYWIVSEPT
jgi:hypothetical protein